MDEVAVSSFISQIQALGIKVEYFPHLGIIKLVRSYSHHFIDFSKCETLHDIDSLDIKYDDMTIFYKNNTSLALRLERYSEAQFNNISNTVQYYSDNRQQPDEVGPMGIARYSQTMFTSWVLADGGKNGRHFNGQFNVIVPDGQNFGINECRDIEKPHLIYQIGDLSIINNRYVSSFNLTRRDIDDHYWLQSGDGQTWMLTKARSSLYLLNKTGDHKFNNLADLIITKSEETGYYGDLAIDEDKYKLIYQCPTSGICFAWNKAAKNYVQLVARRVGVKVKAAVRNEYCEIEHD